nr:SLC13 family permease [Belnapia moabensis]
MTLDQALAFDILGVTVGLFAWGRLPYDLVAMLALLAGLATGIVPAEATFTSFSDDIVIIVASALLVSAAVARSGAVECLMRPLLPHLTSVRTQVPALVAAVMAASVVTKNIGALAIFMPVALQLARRTGSSPSSLLMPMAFASLLGGLMTLIGTSPNIMVSRVRE